MAQLGLGKSWQCILANDNSSKKAKAYRENFPPGNELIEKDIRYLGLSDLPSNPTLAWASFPCQDLSLAGERNGLRGERSSTFLPFWELIVQMQNDGRKVPLIVIENVVGAISSNGGRDFNTIVQLMVNAGYNVGPLVIDAAHFVPQSRPRLFIVGISQEIDCPKQIIADCPDQMWHPKVLVKAYESLSVDLKQDWHWLKLRKPPTRKKTLSQILEDNPANITWHSPEETQKLISMMSEINLRKVAVARKANGVTVGTIYKRTRKDNEGKGIQRAEVRFDQVSGCLRTPAGGSSRQTLLFVNGGEARSRLLSPREAARLMGVSDKYRLPEKYNEGYHLMGDGLVVPVVSWLEKHILRSLAQQEFRRTVR